MTDAQITQAAQNAVSIANSAKALYELCKQYTAHNSVMAYSWSGSAPVTGTNASPDDISNAIYAMTKVIALWEGAGVDATNYGQSFEKLANPLV